MKNKLIYITGFGLLSASIFLSVYALGNQKKMAFYDYNTVYNDCSLKKTLEKDLEGVVSTRKSELDSLQMELSFLSTKIKSGETSQDELSRFEDLKNRYLTFQNRYEEENIRLKEDYFTQIRTEINTKSQEYAKEKGFDYFFSAVGDGSLMYGNESEDVTADFLNYVDK